MPNASAQTITRESRFLNEAQLPQWTLEELRVLTFIDALRLDALVQLLEKKGVFTRDEYVQEITTSVRTRLERVMQSLTLVDELPSDAKVVTPDLPDFVATR